MYYRRKILLTLIQNYGEGLEKIRLQKLLFLFSQGQEEALFHFVPYKFGSFSFQANADLGIMTRLGLVQEDENKWVKLDKFDYSKQLKVTDLKRLKSILLLYGQKTSDELIQITYKKYPYYAINSEIAASKLSDIDFEKVTSARPTNNDTTLFTIGYEGISIEEYLNKLIYNDIKILCDVRRNPISRKYGFSRKQLENACNGVGIKYMHFPEVGIDSELRHNLNSQEDYDSLFKQYENELLPTAENTQKELFALLKTHHRIALTCFEADSCQCHRKPLAESIAKLPDFIWSVKHI